MSRRTDRLGEQFREEISKLIQKGLKDPRVTPLTSITRVDITEDLSYAKALVSVMGSDKEKRDSVIGLNNSAGFIRGVLGKALKIRKIPELNFVLDENLEHAMHIEGILAELKQKGEL
ncbi:MAG: 30S ribosome-binding factor RbfA [Fibrobacter sp.]|nr:30S ribosome-binding factor RbfA [Fibrobacter sp.]